MPNARAFPGIGAIVAISSAKGGVGKSTVTVNLALALTAMGQRVGILDADILGPSIPGMLGVDTSERPRQTADGKVTPPVGHGITLMSMAMLSSDDQPMLLRGPMVGKYLNLLLAGVAWGELDILLLDMPPGTGDIQINIAQNFPIAGALIVTTPQAVSTKIARRGARMFETVQTPVFGVIENMRTFTCPSCGTTTDLFGSGGGERLAADLDLAFLGALPLDPKVMQAGEDGIPLTTGESSAAYARIAATVVGALDSVGAGVPSFRWRWDDDRTAPDWDEAESDANGSPNVPVGLRKSSERTLSIRWGDGVVQDIDVRDLRLSCGCALCKEEMSGRPLLDPATVAGDVHPVMLWNVGNYALGLRWSDGHASGIHPYTAIRAMAARRPIDRLPV